MALSQPAQAASWLAASWARAHLRDLEDRYAAGARELEPEIVRVSKQFGVLSRFTAFVAIDRSAAVNPGGGLRQVVQSVEPPAGWSGTPSAAPFAAGAMPSPAGYAPATFGAAGAAGPASIGRMQPILLDASPPAMTPPPGAYEGRPVPPPATPYEVPPPMPRPVPAPASPPKAFPAMPPLHSPQPLKVSDAPGVIGASAAVIAGYVRRLVELAVDLEALIADGCDGAAIRLVRQRLTEWIEDLRSVGGSRELAEAVEALVRRLSDALAAPMNLAAELEAIADELTKLATDSLPRDAGTKPTRPPFWK